MPLKSVPVLVLLVLLLVAGPSHAVRDLGFDVVTLRNGDIHQGTVAQESFTLETPWGKVTVPYGRMAAIRLGTGDEPDRLVTRQGDVFHGRLRDPRLTVLRVLDTVLDVDRNDVAEIVFAERRLRHTGQIAPDAVETRNGDRFSGRIRVSDLILRNETALELVKRDDIHLIDIAIPTEGEAPRVQITFNNGRIVQGQLVTNSIRVVPRHGQALTLPLAGLETLAFGVHHQRSIPHFRYRQRIAPASLLQDRMVDGSPGPEMIVLRGGEYTRGDLQGDGDADETPPQRVRPGPFAIGIYEVSFNEYDRFCEETGRDKPDDEGWGRGRRPVINVSWKDAVAFTRWLSGKTRHTYRLPTDSEWEYAARAGTTSRFWWGDEPGAARANCEGCGSLWDGEQTARVGKFPPNPFGLHDTAGNVFEWVADCFHDSFASAPADGSAHDQPGCGKRVIRGGAWSFPVREVRSANRWRDFPSRRSDDTGFRVVRELRREEE
ncbi:MAG TPA: formylglycine-generating enzyme family protein [Chromatiales bacterium]|nr:formylglycine-generating enzyme family protein [Chromatiales bacterium]